MGIPKTFYKGWDVLFKSQANSSPFHISRSEISWCKLTVFFQRNSHSWCTKLWVPPSGWASWGHLFKWALLRCRSCAAENCLPDLQARYSIGLDRKSRLPYAKNKFSKLCQILYQTAQNGDGISHMVSHLSKHPQVAISQSDAWWFWWKGSKSVAFLNLKLIPHYSTCQSTFSHPKHQAVSDPQSCRLISLVSILSTSSIPTKLTNKNTNHISAISSSISPLFGAQNSRGWSFLGLSTNDCHLKQTWLHRVASASDLGVNAMPLPHVSGVLKGQS